jgi:hypothetical protein
MKLFVKRFT